MALLLVVLVAAVLVARSCGSNETDVSRERAVEIARSEVTYEPERVMVRYIKRGFRSRPHWAVSLTDERPDGTVALITVVVVDASSGEIAEIRTGG